LNYDEPHSNLAFNFKLRGYASVGDWSKVVIAYEPVWAIGTGKVRRCKVDSINTRVESAYGSSVQRLKLECRKLLLTFAFNSNARRYNKVATPAQAQDVHAAIRAFMAGGHPIMSAPAATSVTVNQSRQSIPPRQ
jgi:hypothetical protein